MATFWKELQQMALGQMFNGGYLGRHLPTAQPTDAPKDGREPKRIIATEPRSHMQIATCR